MINHLVAVVVGFAKNGRRAAFVACALLLGIEWTAQMRGAALHQVSASVSPSTQRVAPRPDGLRAAKLLQSVTVGDFNGDGIMDFAVADFLSDNILVMLGDGDGHFRLAAKLPSAGGPRSIVAGDFNHDGVMDLAVANFFSGDVSIFLGRGDGSFEEPYSIHLAPGLSSLVVADLDSDGSPYLVAANFLSGVLTVLKGAPDGSFAVEATLESVPAVSLVYVQDFNGDVHQDLIAVDASEKQAWLFVGNGHGAFLPGKNIEPQVASLRLATQSQAAATAAALSQLPVIAKAAGDGQLARPGSVLPGNLVAALTESKGGVAGSKPISFSSLYGGASVMVPSPAAAGDQGQMSAKVQSSALPGINFVATSASEGSAVVFGEAAVLQPADFFKQVESALFPSSLGPPGLPGRQLLEKAEVLLRSNDVVGAVVTLKNCLELLTPAESQPSSVTTAPGAAIDLLKRLLNQLILFGPDSIGTISCGQTVSGSITASNLEDYYTFSANAGEVIRWASVVTSGSLNPCADLYNAAGTEITRGPCNGVSNPYTIPPNGGGGYILAVYDSSSSNTGNYNLNLQFLTGQCAASIACGQIKSGSLATAQQDAYIFSANLGEAVNFESMNTSGSLNACADLYTTSGSYTGHTTCNNGSGVYTIPATGNYVFVAHANNYSSTGNYNLSLQFTTGRCATSTGCGQIKSGTLSAVTQQDAYIFSANTGEAVNFESMNTSGSLNACASLYTTSGSYTGYTTCNNGSGVYTIPATGSYVFLAYANNLSSTGNYNLSLQFTTGRCATSTGCGQIKSGTLSAVTQQDAYIFSANAGEAVNFESMNTSGSLNACASLYTTSGSYTGHTTCNNGSGVYTIPATGSYVFLAYANNLSSTGNYNLSLQFTTGRCATSTGCGQIKSGTLSAVTQQDAYIFSANAGEAVNFASMNTSSSLNACASLYTTSGSYTGYTTCNNGNGPYAIPATGNYVFLAYANNLSSTGSYNLSLQFPTGRCAIATGCGQTKSGTLSVVTQEDAYIFSANKGEAVNFASMNTSGSLNACASLYTTSGSYTGYTTCNNGNGPYAIPATGNYVFLAYANNLSSTGNYNLSLQFPTGRCAIATGCGQTKSGTLSVVTQEDAYIFSANKGEAVNFASMNTSSSLNACASLYTTSGSYTGYTTCNNANGPYAIPATGNYVFLAYANNLSSTGNYNLSLQFPTGRCAIATGCGQTKSGTLSVVTQQDAYSFSANAGEAVTFASMATSGTLNACADLYTTTGSYTGYSTCNSRNGPYAIPTTGNYVFVARANNYTSTGNYNLNLQFPTGRCATSTVCGYINTGKFVAAQQDAYIFSANAGGVLTFASAATSGSFTACADLYTSTGSYTGYSACNGTSSAYTAATTGYYVLLAHDNSYTNTENYNAHWQFTIGCPSVTLSPGGLNCGTELLNTSSISKTATLADSIIHALTVTGITNTGANAGDFALANNCGTLPAVVAAGGNCTIGVTFTPSGPGPRKTTLSISDNAPGSPHRVLLTGVGTAVSLSPVSLSFAGQTVGTSSSSQQITVTNKGSATVNFFEIALGGKNPGDFLMSNACGSSLAAAGTCMVTVTFKPTATGARTASVLFSDNGGGNLQSVGLSGTGQ